MNKHVNNYWKSRSRNGKSNVSHHDNVANGYPLYYTGSVEITLNRIEVFSCSSMAVPYYHLTNADGERHIVGGCRIGSLKEIDNPLFEARFAKYFLMSIANAMTDSYEHTRSCHRRVADTGEINERVLIDSYNNSIINLGASNYLYDKGNDGSICLK